MRGPCHLSKPRFVCNGPPLTNADVLVGVISVAAMAVSLVSLGLLIRHAVSAPVVRARSF